MNKYQQEFIGKNVEITKSNIKHQEGMKGTIIDETKNTFTVELHTENSARKAVIMKKGKTFKINNDQIEGNKITKRPEERIKIKNR